MVSLILQLATALLLQQTDPVAPPPQPTADPAALTQPPGGTTSAAPAAEPAAPTQLAGGASPTSSEPPPAAEELPPPQSPAPIPGANFRLESMAHQRVAFKVHHPLRTTVGISHELQGAGRVLDDGTVQVMLRVPIDSLDTGNAAENANTAAVLQPLTYPSVVIRAFVHPSIPVPAGWSNPDDTLEVATDSVATVQLTLHGVTKTLEQVPVHLVYEPHGKVRVSGSFPIDLTAYNVPLPRFFFIHIEKMVELQFDLLWEPPLATR